MTSVIFRVLPFLLGCLIRLRTIGHRALCYNPFCLSGLDRSVPTFMSDFKCLCLLFFHVSLAKRLSISLIFQRANFWFHLFSFCFSILHFLDLCSNRYYFLLAAILGLVCSFLVL